MHPFAFPLLADESISPEVIAGLRHHGWDVAGVVERGLAGSSDVVVLRSAVGEGRVVVTHDSDFGTLAIRGGEPVVGIVYLRPGHIVAARVLEQVDAIRELAIEAEPPFLVVAQRRGDQIRVRLRRLLAL